MSAPRHPVDGLRGWRLRLAAANASGCTDYFSFDPLELFLREARVMERWGPTYVVHVKITEKVAGLTNWMPGEGSCPLEACMRAFIKSRQRQAP